MSNTDTSATPPDAPKPIGMRDLLDRARAVIPGVTSLTFKLGPGRVLLSDDAECEVGIAVPWGTTPEAAVLWALATKATTLASDARQAADVAQAAADKAKQRAEAAEARASEYLAAANKVAPRETTRGAVSQP